MLPNWLIEHEMEEGRLSIESPPHLPLVRVGPASVDLHVDELVRYVPPFEDRGDPMGDLSFMVNSAQPTGIWVSDKIMEQCTKTPTSNGNWLLVPGQLYFARIAEAIKTKLPFEIATRSTPARVGLKVHDVQSNYDPQLVVRGAVPTRHGRTYRHESEHPIVAISTCGTHVELPKNYPLCQMMVGEQYFLSATEVRAAMKSKQIAVSGKPKMQVNPSNSIGSVGVRLYKKVLVYEETVVLNPAKQENGDGFAKKDITKGLSLKPGAFFIASTAERIRVGSGHVAFLDEGNSPMPQWPYIKEFDTYRTHGNAPRQWPGRSKTMTLEGYAVRPASIKKGDFAGRLYFQQLAAPVRGNHVSRYEFQNGPTINRI